MHERCCVFVDGENLRYSICDLFSGVFDKSQYLPKKANWAGLFDWMVSRIGSGLVRLRTYWYAIEQIDFKPYLPLPSDENKLRQVLSRNKAHKTEIDSLSEPARSLRMANMAQECQRHADRMRLRFEGWRRIQDGIAHAHNAVEFRRAGAISYDLFTGQFGPEKAVDVKLAIDLSELRNIYEVAIIVSGDQDYVPAVQVVKDHGKRVINVAFEGRNGRLLPGGARRLNQITDSALIVKYNDLGSHLGL